MTIKYRYCNDGSFVAGETTSFITSYAYPTSPYANESKREPLKTAKAMLASEDWRKPCNFVPNATIRHYDARNWDVLNG